MAQETVSTFTPLLREYYTNDTIQDATYATNALLALVAKMTDFQGKNLPLPIIFGNPQGGSADLATAVTNKGSSQTQEFALTRVSDYSLASIGREVIKASQGMKGAALEAAKVNIDGAIRTAVRSLAIAMYRSGTGAIGQISAASNVGTATITLADINSITNFETKMVLQLSATDGSAARTGSVTITALDRGAGTITLGGNWTAGIAAAAAGDFIYRQGDINKKLSGLNSWLPKTAPTVGGGDSQFTVDRSSDPVRLAGVRHDGTAQSIEEALMDGQSKVAREGGVPTHCFLNNVQYRQLLKSLTSKVHYIPTKAEANARIAFSGIQIEGDAGPIKVIPDFNCPSQVAYILQLDTWKLYSLDEAPHIFDKDNDQEMLRESTTDGYELRVGYYAQLGCNAPGWNGRVELAAAT